MNNFKKKSRSKCEKEKRCINGFIKILDVMEDYREFNGLVALGKSKAEL